MIMGMSETLTPAVAPLRLAVSGNGKAARLLTQPAAQEETVEVEEETVEEG